jgi:hypothetical protein
MPAKVTVTITGLSRGNTDVVPYNRAQGLQRRIVGGVVTNQLVVYQVPSYEVRVEGARTYAAIRFGLQNNGTVTKTRRCDVGISNAQVCTPEWVPGYRPHSFGGLMRQGAWRVLPGRQFLIHEGPDSRTQHGGSFGCIEILDRRWNDFLADIERLAGMPAPDISRTKALKVVFETAPFPTATLVE